MTFALQLKDSLQFRESQVPVELANGDPLGEILVRHLLAVEAAADTEMLTSILLLQGGNLTHGAAPNLPPAYCSSIDGSEIGPNAGSCGTAAFFGRPVYVTDIETDPLWADYRELALSFGLRACWSTPIYGARDEVIGTFAIYHLTPRAPTSDEVKAIQTITSCVAQAIVQSNRSSNGIGEYAGKASPNPVLKLVGGVGTNTQDTLLRDIAWQFDALTRAIELGIDAFAVDGSDGPDIRSLQHAKKAAQEGAALARSAIEPKETDPE